MQLVFDADVEEFVAFLNAHLPDQAETVQRSSTADRCGANNGPEAGVGGIDPAGTWWIMRCRWVRKYGAW
jgi:hypothetical protein